VKKKYTIEQVSHELALEIVQLGITQGATAGVAVSIAVVDMSLGLVAFAKADGATPHSVETSRRKAQTAASTRKESGWMNSDLETKLPLASGNLLTNIPGGFPIVVDGVVIGGFGVAGGTVEQDAQVAAKIASVI